MSQRVEAVTKRATGKYMENWDIERNQKCTISCKLNRGRELHDFALVQQENEGKLFLSVLCGQGENGKQRKYL